MELAEVKARSKAVWSTGDYAPTARALEPVSVALVASLGIGPAHRVLDVAAGNGNCALAAARQGATVVASDFSPVMVARGRERTAASGLDVSWQEADAADLPFDDGSFDRVTSVFGAMFAPEQELTARELVRVVAPGGAAGLTTWMADGLFARLLHDLAPPTEPTHDRPPDPMAWGDRAHVERLFSPTDGEVTVTRRQVTFAYPSWDAWRRDFEAHGMFVVMKETLPADTYEAFVVRAHDHFASVARPDGHGIAYDADYLEIRIDVPA